MRELYEFKHSAVHQMDARVKVIFTLAFIIFLNLTPTGAWPAYILFLTLILSAGVLSRLGLGLLVRRSLFALPFALAAIPLIFTGPLPHVNLTIFQRVHVNISPAGLERFMSITLKLWVSVQAAVLLSATTRFPDLLAALQQLRVPKLFVAILGLMWRYLFVISDEASRMLRARTSRSAAEQGAPRKGGSIGWRARVTGGMAGSLFLRSLERSDRVYAAMAARGYNGELPASEARPLPAGSQRILALGFCVLFLLLVLGLLTGG